VDQRLNAKEKFMADDVVYIQKHYPKVYQNLRDMKIAVQYDPKLAESVYKTLSFQSNTNSENLYWYFHQPPYKEILEAVTQPMGNFGFNGEIRNLNGTNPNQNFLKLTIVSGAQIQKYDEQYQPVQDTMNKKYQVLKTKTNQEIAKETQFIHEQILQYKCIMYFAAILGIICLILIAYFHSKASCRT
jgi:hypothetical protein